MILARHTRKKKTQLHEVEASCPRPKETRPSLKRQKQLVTVFSDVQVLFLVDWLEPGRTINSNQYCEITRTLRRRIQPRHPCKWEGHVQMHNENARPYKIRNTSGTLVALGITVLPQHLYSPDLPLGQQDEGRSQEPTRSIFCGNACNCPYMMHQHPHPPRFAFQSIPKSPSRTAEVH